MRPTECELLIKVQFGVIRAFRVCTHLLKGDYPRDVSSRSCFLLVPYEDIYRDTHLSTPTHRVHEFMPLNFTNVSLSFNPITWEGLT